MTRTRIDYQGVRITTRAFYQFGQFRRFRYSLLPGPSRPLWMNFHCTRPFRTREEALEAARQAIDGRLQSAPAKGGARG